MSLIIRFAGFVLMVVFYASPPALVAQDANPEDVKRMLTDDLVSDHVFGDKDNESKHREMYDLFVESEIQSIREYCDLTKSQQDKLRLAGKGDYAQWQKRIQDYRVKYVGRPLSFDDRRLAEIELSFIRIWPHERESDRDGLFQKTLKSSITSEQKAGYDAYRRWQRTKQLNRTWDFFEKDTNARMSLSKESRQKLNEFFLANVPPLPGIGHYRHLIILLQLEENKDRTRALLTEEEWTQFEARLNGVRGMERYLRHFELWPVKVEKQDTTK